MRSVLAICAGLGAGLSAGLAVVATSPESRGIRIFAAVGFFCAYLKNLRDA